MMWIGFTFNLCVALLLSAYLLRAVRRYERRADAMLARIDAFEEAQRRTFAADRDELRIHLRTQVDAGLAFLRHSNDSAGSVPVSLVQVGSTTLPLPRVEVRSPQESP